MNNMETTANLCIYHIRPLNINQHRAITLKFKLMENLQLTLNYNYIFIILSEIIKNKRNNVHMFSIIRFACFSTVLMFYPIKMF